MKSKGGKLVTTSGAYRPMPQMANKQDRLFNDKVYLNVLAKKDCAGGLQKGEVGMMWIVDIKEVALLCRVNATTT